jgi:RloB-like protein
VTKQGGRPLGRQHRDRPTRRTILVFTEGQKTEPSYLAELWRAHRETVVVKVSDRHGTPATLVAQALVAQREGVRAAKKGRGDTYDEIWCVFDIDEHPNVRAAIADAAQQGIGVAVSNPCIELWFLLHWEEQTAEIDRASAQRRASVHVGSTKALTPETVRNLMERFATAKHRAKALDERHRGNRTAEPGNPSSTMWRLVDAITQRP